MAWEPSKHPRWPDETPGGLGGQFMEVPDLFDRLKKQVSGSMNLNFMLTGGKGTPRVKRLEASLLDDKHISVTARDGKAVVGTFKISRTASTADVMDRLKQVDVGGKPDGSSIPAEKVDGGPRGMLAGEADPDSTIKRFVTAAKQVFGHRSKTRSEVVSHWQASWDTLNGDQRAAIEDYVFGSSDPDGDFESDLWEMEGGYLAVYQDRIRTGNEDSLHRDDLRAAAYLDEAIKQHARTPEMQVYRLVDHNVVLQEGFEFTDPGFMSTTVGIDNLEMVADWVAHGQAPSTLMVINLPEGSEAALLRDTVPEFMPMEVVADEVLIQRNSTFRVDSVRWSEQLKVHVAELSLIGQGMGIFEPASDQEWVDPPAPRGKNKGRGGAGGYTSDHAETTLTDLGREGELLFAKLTGGEVLHPPGRGEQSPLDVRVGDKAYEVKTVSADSTSYKATPKPHEISAKEAHAKELGVEPALAIVVVDREAGTAKVYERDGLKGGRLSKNTGWRYMGEVELRVDTQQKYLGPDGMYEDARVREIHDPIVRHFLEGHKKAKGTPKTLFMAGGSGSGKSTVRDGLEDKPDDAVIVDPDAIKEMLPEYQEMVQEGDKRAAKLVHEESSDIAKRLMEEANKRGFNVIIDGTGDSEPGKFSGKVDAAKAAGRDVKVVLVDIDTEEAIKRAMDRAKETGRRVPPSEIKAIHEAVAARYLEWRDKVDDWEVWVNDGDFTEPPRLIARRIGGGAIEVIDPARHTRIIKKAGSGAATGA